MFRRIVLIVPLVLTMTASGSSQAAVQTGASSAGPTRAHTTRATTATIVPGTLTVADNFAYPPFEYINAQGKEAGLDVTLSRALGRILHLKVNFVKIPFTAELPGLASGRYDMVDGSTTDTAARRREASFVDWFRAGEVVSVTKVMARSIHGPGDLCGHRVGFAAGAYALSLVPRLQAQCKRKGKSAFSVKVFPDEPTLVLALLDGRVDARLDDSSTSAYFARSARGQVVNVGPVIAPSLDGLGFAKTNKTLIKAVAVAMQKLINNGTYARILTAAGEEQNAVKHVTINAGHGL